MMKKASVLNGRTAWAAAAGLSFAAGYIATFHRIPGDAWRYFLLSSVSALCACLVVYDLAGRGKRATASWLLVCLLFVFGYLKYIWILFDPVSPRQFFPRYVWPSFALPEFFFPVFAVQTLGFIGACLGILISFHLLDRSANDARDGMKAQTLPRISFCAWGISAASAALTLLSVKIFNVGVLGADPRPLPLHLSGVIYYSQTILLPMAIAAQIYIAEKNGKSTLARAFILLLFLWAGGDALVRASRASLMEAPLILVFMAFCGGVTIRRAELAAISAVLVIGLLITPLTYEYRLLRVAGVGVMESMRGMAGQLSNGWYSLFKTAIFFFFRIPGAETVFALLGMGTEPLKGAFPQVLVSTGGLPEYLTREVFRVTYVMSYAPSFIGGAYAIWGYPAILLSSISAAAISVFGWNRLPLAKLQLGPVIAAFFLLIFFMFLTEGLTPIAVKQAVSAAAACALLEALSRWRSGSQL